MYMDRNREARRTSIVGSNGFNRRRHRTSSLRGSPDEDVGLELHESMRLRERVKKDRDRDRYRDRERDLRERDSRDRDLRDRDSRERPDRMMNSVKRRRNERLTNHRDDTGNDETSEESVNDDEDEDNNISTTTNHHHHHHNNFSFSQIHRNHNTNNHNMTNGINSNLVTSGSNHHLQQRKSFPLSSTTSNYAKAFKGPPVWRSGDEVISVSVPRKARSASTKRSNYWISGTGNNNSGGGVGDGEQIHRPTSGSPARHDVVPPSPPSYSASLRKKLKPSVNNNNTGLRLKPPKAVSKPTSSNPEELEIEIAEVLYGLMTQSQVTSSKKDEVDRSSTDAKSKPFSNSTSANNPVCVPKSSPLIAIAPKRKRPRQVPENLIYGNRSSPITAIDADQTPKSEIPSPSNLEKISVENGSEMGGNSAILQVQATAQSTEPESSAKFDSESKPSVAELRGICKVVAKEELTTSRKIEESSGMRTEGILSDEVSTSLQASNLKVSVVESHQKGEKFEIDLMASPPQVRSSSTEREADLDSRSTATKDKKPVLSVADVELKPAGTSKVKEDGNVKKDQLVMEEEEKSKRTREESKPVLANENNNVRKFDLQLDLEKPKRDGTSDGGTNAKLPVTANREDPVIQKSGQASSLPLPLSLASWPGGLPPMGYMGAPLQGVVSMDAPAPAQPIPPFFPHVGRERCATHCHIAKNIYYHQQFMKMNPYWQAASTTPLMFGSKPCSDLHSNINVKGTNNAPDNKTQSLLNNSKGSSQITSTSDSSQRKQHQQVLIQQALPPVAPNNLLGPAFIFPLNQQQAALSVRPTTGKSQTGESSTNVVGVNESQYLAILQNNGYPFPLPAAPNFRGPPPPPPGQAAMPMFNGSFFPQSQQIGNASNTSSSSQRLQSSGANNGLSNSEDIPSSDNHGSRMPAVNIYGQNFMMPIHPQNFALMTPFTSGNNNQVEKKTNQPRGVNPGIESLAPHHGFAMSFGPPINANPGSGIDMSSMVQTHLMYQNSPEAMRQNIQMIAAPAAQKKNGKVSEDAKSCNGDERKGLVEKSHGGVGQSIAFTRSDLSDHTTNSARPSNANLVGEISVQNAHVQAQNQQLGSNNRIKVPVSSNGIVFSEQLSSPAISAKFQNALSGFSQNLIQTSNGMPFQSQSPQWKGSSSARVAATSQTHSPVASPASTFKGLPQHSSRSQQAVHTQISFGGNQKPSTNSQGQAQTGTNSPTTSSVSRGASGSPRTSSFSGQQPKNSVSIPVQKSPSILGNPHVSSSPSHGGAKTQIQPQNSQHQQQQQQLMLKNMQQGQLIFSNPLAQVQSSSNSSGPTGYYMHQHKRLDKHQATSSGGMLSLSPTMANSTGTNDPAKAIAAATNNAKNGGFPSQGVFNASQFAAQPGGTIMPGFSYIHPVPAGVQTKQSEQKKHTGNDNLHQWQPEKK